MHTLGVDIGGTFLDLAAISNNGEVTIEKVPTTGSADEIFDEVLNGLRKMNIKPSEIERVAFGTTIATNVLIERKGERIGLLCTKGFKDILEHQRWHRRYQYFLHEERPKPLVPRWLRLEIDERTSSDGNILKNIQEDEICRALELFKLAKVKSIAICFLNAHANGENEKRAAEIISRFEPQIYLSLSSSLAPLIREWERTSTAVINAYCQPVAHLYLESFERELKKAAPQCSLTVMQSNGGVTSVEQAIEKPVRTMISGPTGGVMGAAALTQQTESNNVITLDMGGTSCDVSVLKEGVPELTKEAQVEYNMPIMVPMIRMETIGAGGGSIAWVDHGGVMKVGPNSAGADPGPVCYCRGGEEPTLTDAQLLLGRLTIDGLLGGRMSLSVEDAIQAFKKKICIPLGIKIHEAVTGVIKIANVKMSEAIRLLTTNRGMDPRDFTLVAFGGAGPMHACELAEMLGINRIIIPSYPGVMSAVGLASADRKTDAVISVNCSLEKISIEEINNIFCQLEESCRSLLNSQGILPNDQMLIYSGDFRYEGQSFEVMVNLDGLNKSKDCISEIKKRFHEKHFELYRYSRDDETPFIVSFQVIGIENNAKKIKLRNNFGIDMIKSEDPEFRKVYSLSDESYLKVPVYKRNLLNQSWTAKGPAIIEQFDTTTLITSKFEGGIDDIGNIVIQRSVN